MTASVVGSVGAAAAEPTTGSWFRRPVTPAERDRVLSAAGPILARWVEPSERSPGRCRSSAKRNLDRLLDWLDTLPGSTYQDRWEAAKADSSPYAWCPELTRGVSHRAGARLALNALIIIGVIRPSCEWLLATKQRNLWREWTAAHDVAAWTGYFQAADREHVPERRRWSTAAHLVRISLTTGTPITELRASDVLHYRDWLVRTNRSPGELLAMWHYSRQAGLLAGEPNTLEELLLVGQLTPAGLVDRYPLKSQKVRQLLIEYVAELSTTQDYSSLEGSSRMLASLFWLPIEAANPGIDTIRLTPAQAAAWKVWLKTKSDGTARRRADSVLSTIRSFYVDLAAWAEQDPSRWAEWAVPSPISFREIRGTARKKTLRQHDMQSRTRSLAPHLPALAAAAKRNHEQAVEVCERAHRTPVGESFELHGHRYTRLPFGPHSWRTGYMRRDDSPGRVDTEWQVTTTFMTWAIVDALRHTGIRVEELLELTHLSIRQYRKPDGTVLPLLQIAPSKNEQERIVPCSPELTATLARLITFISLDGRVPVCARRDTHERVHSAPMPFLFQLREAGRSRVINPGTVRTWLGQLSAAIDLKDTDGSPLRFTPHDFRRLFITDIVNAGFPIHLAATLVGHNNIEVTRSYTAVYQRDVFEAYEQFITDRRLLRPTAEYREPTQQEGGEFVQHFGQRKIALGNCRRPYGADCVHEHACLRCDFLQIEPSQLQRLSDIRTNLQAQVDEAQRNQWLGDVDQLRRTIDHADRKAAQLLEWTSQNPPELTTATPMAANSR